MVCSTTLTPAIPGDESPVQPANGLTFEGHGAYGSEFDPMDGRYTLIVNICDECLSTKGKEGAVVMKKQERATLPPPIYTHYEESEPV